MWHCPCSHPPRWVIGWHSACYRVICNIAGYNYCSLKKHHNEESGPQVPVHIRDISTEARPERKDGTEVATTAARTVVLGIYSRSPHVCPEETGKPQHTVPEGTGSGTTPIGLPHLYEWMAIGRKGQITNSTHDGSLSICHHCNLSSASVTFA